MIITGSLDKEIDVDISYFSGLNRLKYLKLENVNIINKHSILDLQNLTSIQIANSNIHSLDFLTGLELSEISIQRSQLTSFDLIEKFYNLHSINFWGNQINDISNLENVQNLTYIDLGNNNIESIASLEKFENLEFVNLMNNNIYNCDVIENKRLLIRNECE